MSIMDYILIWLGLISTGFFIGIGSKTAEYFYEIYLKDRYNKIHIKFKRSTKIEDISAKIKENKHDKPKN